MKPTTTKKSSHETHSHVNPDSKKPKVGSLKGDPKLFRMSQFDRLFGKQAKRDAESGGRSMNLSLTR